MGGFIGEFGAPLVSDRLGRKLTALVATAAGASKYITCAVPNTPDNTPAATGAATPPINSPAAGVNVGMSGDDVVFYGSCLYHSLSYGNRKYDSWTGAATPPINSPAAGVNAVAVATK